MSGGLKKAGASATAAAGPTVYVVDDDPSVRRSMARLLKTHGFSAEIFACAEEFLALGHYASPSCLVLDVRMPGLNGLQLQEKMAALNLSLPVVFITGHGDVPMSVKAMKAGAVDFLPKPFSPKDLLSSIRFAIEKNQSDSALAAGTAAVKQRLNTLTPRELEVLRLVVKGKMNKEIADDLKLSIKTVKVHRGRVMRKMEAASLAELVRMAGAVGLS
ncbi:MAG: response regulator transcription factor [Candidatus Eisenbacteria bacterium]|nr:response regulator transcription factor [Candidatus Eisenbacteria bacterium]